jgi:hypothetical protein
MSNIGLEVLALAVQTLPSFKSRLSHFSGNEKWKYEDGYNYTPIDNWPFLQHFPTDSAIEDLKRIEFEWVEVASEIKPHYHQHSDSVALCVGSSQYFEGHVSIGGVGFWLPLCYRQIILIPAGSPHGFRRVKNDKPDLLLLVASFPGITDDDVVYV